MRKKIEKMALTRNLNFENWLNGSKVTFFVPLTIDKKNDYQDEC